MPISMNIQAASANHRPDDASLNTEVYMADASELPHIGDYIEILDAIYKVRSRLFSYAHDDRGWHSSVNIVVENADNERSRLVHE